MWFAHRHRRTPAKDWAAIPFWSLTLPSWATAQPTRSHRMGEPELTTRTYATCGTVENGIAAVTRHVDSDNTQGASLRAFRSRVAGDRTHPVPRQ
jgi:hypothetical protein